MLSAINTIHAENINSIKLHPQKSDFEILNTSDSEVLANKISGRQHKNNEF